MTSSIAHLIELKVTRTPSFCRDKNLCLVSHRPRPPPPPPPPVNRPTMGEKNLYPSNYKKIALAC